MKARFRILFALPLAAAALSGCTREIYYREGAQVTQVQAAESACGLEALTRAPVRNETRIYQGSFVPPERICRDDGRCRTIPGYFEPPEVVTVDVNAPERRLAQRSCMAQKGFARISLPLCNEAVKAQVPPGLGLPLPPVGETSCIVPRGGSAYQVVTPVKG